MATYIDRRLHDFICHTMQFSVHSIRRNLLALVLSLISSGSRDQSSIISTYVACAERTVQSLHAATNVLQRYGLFQETDNRFLLLSLLAVLYQVLRICITNERIV